MKNTILGFKQRKLIEFDLDLKDALILRYFVDFMDTGRMSMIKIKNKQYYWINYKHLKEDIPVIGIKSNDALRRRLKKLEECKIFGHYHKLQGGSYSYYCLGESYPLLGVDFKDKKSDFYNLGSEIENLYDTDLKVSPSKIKSCSLATENKEQNNLSIKDIKYTKEDIEEIWSLYPNKKGKAESIRKIPKILNKISKEELIRCVLIYAEEVKGRNRKYILNGSTFFNGRYEDYLQEEITELKNEKIIEESIKFNVKLEEDM
ncbi:hypothetical protein NNC19_04905 [Clostridium sp. SHJSY1]|uniref:hypothetical protein n=1 Tax=Clostridium sp. SHJSY1 TaxID=2942483 RepID=UPI002873F924|nr:hypothetical protein [Clostridium sp. SHJSY1]MDS0525011.1 hypothetical protein [Clostridium sp. SHJSY1]